MDSDLILVVDGVRQSTTLRLTALVQRALFGREIYDLVSLSYLSQAYRRLSARVARPLDSGSAASRSGDCAMIGLCARSRGATRMKRR